MAKELPYFRWWVARAETDEKYASMTDEERGFYHRCLNRAWSNDGLPADTNALCRLMHISEENLSRLWVAVGPCWHQKGDRLYNSTQEEERSHAISKGEANKRPGNANAIRTRSTENANAIRTRSTENANAIRTRSTENANETRSVREENAFVPQRAYDSDSSSEQEKLPTEAFDFETSFAELWSTYPAKGRTKKVLSMQYYCDEIRSAEGHAELMEGIRGPWAASKKWAEGFVLNLPEWLHNRCWEEEPEPFEQATKKPEVPTFYEAYPHMRPGAE